MSYTIRHKPFHNKLLLSINAIIFSANKYELMYSLNLTVKNTSCHLAIPKIDFTQVISIP